MRGATTRQRDRTHHQGDLEEQAENAEDAAIDNTRVPKHSIDHHKKYRHKKRAPLHKGRGHEVGSFWGELEFLGVTQTRIATVDATTVRRSTTRGDHAPAVIPTAARLCVGFLCGPKRRVPDRASMT